jgi:hypothetical protein
MQQVAGQPAAFDFWLEGGQRGQALLDLVVAGLQLQAAGLGVDVDGVALPNGGDPCRSAGLTRRPRWNVLWLPLVAEAGENSRDGLVVRPSTCTNVLADLLNVVADGPRLRV